MPISSQVPIIGYVANGVTKSFAFPFAILSADDLKVKVGADVVTTGFSIAGVGDRNGGSVTFTDAPASSIPIILYREVTLDRTTDYQENGDLLAVVLDDDLDRVWMALQDQLLLSDRALRSPLGETLQQLPPASERALMALAFDASGNPIVVRGTNDGGAALALDLLDPAPGKGAALVGFDWAALPAAINKIDWGIQTARSGVNVLRYIPPEEWPAVLNGTSTTDLTAYIQAAIDATKKTGNLGRAGAPELFFPFGAYICASGLNIDGGHIVLVGENSTIQYMGSGNAVFIGDASYLTDLAEGYFYAGFKRITIKCTDSAAKCVVNSGYRKLEFDGAYLRGGAIGLETEGCWSGGIFRNSTCQNQASHGIHIKQRNNMFMIDGSAVLGAGGNGVLLSTASAELKGVRLRGVDLEGCAGAINVTGNTGNLTVESCWFENNNTYNIRISNETGDSNKRGIVIRGNQITGDGVDVLIGTSTTGTLISGMEVFGNEFAGSDLVVIGGNNVSGLVEYSNTFESGGTKTLPASSLSTPVSGIQPLFETAPTEPYGFNATGRQGEFRYSATAGRVWVKASNGASAGGWLLFQAQQVNDYANQLVSLPTGSTPSVANRLACRSNNGSATTITSFTGGYASQELLIVGSDGGNTTIGHGTNIRLVGGANFTLGDNDTIRLLCVDGTKWVEVSRSNNN